MFYVFMKLLIIVMVIKKILVVIKIIWKNEFSFLNLIIFLVI